MRLRLYQYDGARWVPNKIDVNAAMTQKYDAENDPGFRLIRSEFSPMRATFVLDRLIHGVNYALYDYDGIDWFGYVEVSTDAGGLHRYDVTVDPLTTAWYRGCMAVRTLVRYSAESSLIPDTRQTVNPLTSEIAIIDPSAGSFRECAIVLNVVEYEASLDADLLPYQTPGSVASYVFIPWTTAGSTTRALVSLMHFLYEYVQIVNGRSQGGALLDGVQDIYVIPEALYPHNTPRSTITITTPPSNFIQSFFKFDTITVPRTTAGHEYHAIRWPLNADRSPLALTFPLSSTIRRAADVRAGEWRVHVPYIGDIRIDPGFIPSNASYVVVTLSLNVRGGFVTARWGYQRGSNTVYHDAVIEMRIRETTLMPKQNADQGALLRLLGAEISAVAGAMNKFTGPGSGPVESLLSAVGPIGSADAFGSVGGVGDRNVNGIDIPTLFIDYHPYIDSTYPDRYGYPCGQLLRVDTLSGYVQTDHAEINANGLPSAIVEAAEDALNAGVYIV